jgi:uncharacterized membrane protein YfcA
MLLVAGALAGTLAGLLGIGGGIIIVPVLALVFQHWGVGPQLLMHLAIGTSLSTIVVTSLVSIRAHQRRRAVHWNIVRQITPGVVVGGVLGATIADSISGETLRVSFALFMLLVAAQLAFGGPSQPHRRLPGRSGMWLAGTGIGTVAALMGVGGGSMSVPFLTWCNVAVRNAVATSAAIGFPIALAGSAGFVVTGLHETGRPAWSLGYISLPAFFGIVTASTLLAPLGVRLAHTLPERVLKRVFAGFLLVLGVKLLLG